MRHVPGARLAQVEAPSRRGPGLTALEEGLCQGVDQPCVAASHQDDQPSCAVKPRRLVVRNGVHLGPPGIQEEGSAGVLKSGPTGDLSGEARSRPQRDGQGVPLH